MTHPSTQSSMVCPLTIALSLLNCNPVIPISNSLMAALANYI